MKVVAHRINYLDAKNAAHVFSSCDGIEFDIRDNNGQIIVQHDPYGSGQPFTEFVRFCVPNKLYIVNVKSEGIEEDAIRIMDDAGLTNFFLLDCGTPSIVRLGRRGERRIAARFSEYESFETVYALGRAGYISWVWVDVFSTIPLSSMTIELFHNAGLKICLVSPELQAQQEKIKMYKDEVLRCGAIDAVCTKLPNASIWTGDASPFPN
jgi:hypothetical protein